MGFLKVLDGLVTCSVLLWYRYEAYNSGARFNVSDADHKDFPIRADLNAMTVTVDAGVPQRMFIEYLVSLGYDAKACLADAVRDGIAIMHVHLVLL